MVDIIVLRCAICALALWFLSWSELSGQDTFSIVAVDSMTGEVGAAGASCVDLNNFGGLTDHFLGELFPDSGAIVTQAWYQPANQVNARDLMRQGATPDSIIEWLQENDIQNSPQLRQYGVVGFVNGSPKSAAHTGTSTDDYKGHRTGPGYSIQGNILLGPEILDQMEANFLNTEGDLVCKLMAAMQGANVVGADSRCASNGSSSLFAFVKVAQPNDVFGSPFYIRSVRTGNGDGIEPIDSLQKLVDADMICETSGIGSSQDLDVSVYPNPVSDKIYFRSSTDFAMNVTIVHVATGVHLDSHRVSSNGEIDFRTVSKGLYLLRIEEGLSSTTKLVVKL